jgi:8-oxo-dGTP diphosphatase
LASTHPTLATLVYRIWEDKVLLLRRRKPPFPGFWVAPGGKVDPGESPASCAVRELEEETGFVATRIHLRGLVRETSPQPEWQWLLFIYAVTQASGSLRGESPEGDLRWWDISSVPAALMPDADRIFFPRVIDLSTPPYEALFTYDADLRLCSAVEYGGDGAPRKVEW